MQNRNVVLKISSKCYSHKKANAYGDLLFFFLSCFLEILPQSPYGFNLENSCWNYIQKTHKRVNENPTNCNKTKWFQYTSVPIDSSRVMIIFHLKIKFTWKETK